MDPGVFTDLSTSEEGELTETERAVALAVSHSTHLEALAWAAGKAGPGAVLEVGSGWYSTPWLHGWCQATGRWLCTIETEEAWAQWVAELYGNPEHEVRWLPRGVATVPPEGFALALVDGINEDRAGWIRALARTPALVVVHDTETTRTAEFPEVRAAFAGYTYRRDFQRVYPYSAVVWNDP